MLLVLTNIFILLTGIGFPIGALCWKHFAHTSKESIRAAIATTIGIIGLSLFFLQTFIMTTHTGENVITLIKMWLGN
jgi:phage tail protein X